jgi:hypothetical protein
MADELETVEQGEANPELFSEDELPATIDEAFEAGEAAVDADDLVVTTEPAPTPLGRSWAFDFSAHRFVMAGHQPIETRRTQTLRYWIEKCLRSPRGGCVIHPPSYGLDSPTDVFGDQFDSADIASLEERIADALLFHPAISGIENFQAEQDAEDDEALLVRFEVVLDDATTLAIEEGLSL